MDLERHARRSGQLAPQPAHRNPRQDHAREYGYTSGEFLSNSGHLRVRVAPRELTVAYVRSASADMARFKIRNGDVAASYRLPSL